MNFIKKIVARFEPNSESALRFEEDGVYTVDRVNRRTGRVGFVAFIDEHDQIDSTTPTYQTRQYYFYAESYLADVAGDPRIKKEIRDVLKAIDPKTGSYDHSALVNVMFNIYKLSLVENKIGTGLTRAIIKGHVGSSYSPGVNFLGDKEFYIYISALIRH